MGDIKIFEYGESPPVLYRFRYSIYVEEMRRTQRYANHDDQTIIDPLDDTSTNVLAYNAGVIIGCVRVNFLRAGAVGEYFSFYRIDALDAVLQERVSITTRLMIDRAWRRTPVTIMLITTIYEYALRRGILIDFIDCNRHLVGFFVKFGYRPQFVTTHPEYGEVTVMRIDVFDLTHLEAVNSPFAPILRQLMDEEKGAASTRRLEMV